MLQAIAQARLGICHIVASRIKEEWRAGENRRLCGRQVNNALRQLAQSIKWGKQRHSVTFVVPGSTEVTTLMDEHGPFLQRLEMGKTARVPPVPCDTNTIP